MKVFTYAAVAAGMFYGVIAAGSTAEAARCPSGQIYRPSQGVCVSKASAQRAGIYRQRYARASVKHRAKRRAPVVRAQSFPPPTPPWAQRTPIIDGAAPEQFSVGPFGRLLPMPETVVSWSIRNRSED